MEGLSSSGMKLWGDGAQPGWRRLLRVASWLLAYIALAALDHVVALRLDALGLGLADGAAALTGRPAESLRFHWQLALAVLILLQQERWRRVCLWCLVLLAVELGLSGIERAPLGLGGAVWGWFWASLWPGTEEAGSPWPLALHLPLQALVMLGLARATRWPWAAPAGGSRGWHALQRAGLVALSAGLSEVVLMGEGVSAARLLLSAGGQALALSLSWAWLAGWLQPAESNRRECLQLAAVAGCGLALSVALGWQWQREQELDQRQHLEAQAVQRGMAVQAQIQAIEQQLRLLRGLISAPDSAASRHDAPAQLARGMLDAHPALEAVLLQPSVAEPALGGQVASATLSPPIRGVPADRLARLPVQAGDARWAQLWQGAGRDELRWLPAAGGSSAWLLLRAGSESGAGWLAAGLNWGLVLEAAAQRAVLTGEPASALHMQVSDAAQGWQARWPSSEGLANPMAQPLAEPSPESSVASVASGSWALWGQARSWQRSMGLPGAGAELQLQFSATLTPWRASTPGHVPPASGFAILWLGLLLTGGLQLALGWSQQRRRRQSVFGQERQLDLEQSLLMLDYSVQQFHRQSEQLHALLDATPVGYAAFDAPGQELYSNKAFAMLSGAEADAAMPSLPSLLRQLASRASPAAVAAEL